MDGDVPDLVDLAVSLGFKRSIVESMSEAELLKCLDRWEPSDDAVY